MLVDVKKAFLSTGASTDTSTSGFLRKKKRRRRGKWMGRHKKAMYSTRDAPAAWQSEVERTMKEAVSNNRRQLLVSKSTRQQTCGLLSMWMFSCALGLSQGLQTFVGVSKTSM